MAETDLGLKFKVTPPLPHMQRIWQGHVFVNQTKSVRVAITSNEKFPVSLPDELRLSKKVGMGQLLRDLLPRDCTTACGSTCKPSWNPVEYPNGSTVQIGYIRCGHESEHIWSMFCNFLTKGDVVAAADLSLNTYLIMVPVEMARRHFEGTLVQTSKDTDARSAYCVMICNCPKLLVKNCPKTPTVDPVPMPLSKPMTPQQSLIPANSKPLLPITLISRDNPYPFPATSTVATALSTTPWIKQQTQKTPISIAESDTSNTVVQEEGKTSSSDQQSDVVDQTTKVDSRLSSQNTAQTTAGTLHESGRSLGAENKQTEVPIQDKKLTSGPRPQTLSERFQQLSATNSIANTSPLKLPSFTITTERRQVIEQGSLTDSTSLNSPGPQPSALDAHFPDNISRDWNTGKGPINAASFSINEVPVVSRGGQPSNFHSICLDHQSGSSNNGNQSVEGKMKNADVVEETDAESCLNHNTSGITVATNGLDKVNIGTTEAIYSDETSVNKMTEIPTKVKCKETTQTPPGQTEALLNSGASLHPLISHSVRKQAVVRPTMHDTIPSHLLPLSGESFTDIQQNNQHSTQLTGAGGQPNETSEASSRMGTLSRHDSNQALDTKNTQPREDTYVAERQGSLLAACRMTERLHQARDATAAKDTNQKHNDSRKTRTKSESSSCKSEDNVSQMEGSVSESNSSCTSQDLSRRRRERTISKSNNSCTSQGNQHRRHSRERYFQRREVQETNSSMLSKERHSKERRDSDTYTEIRNFDKLVAKQSEKHGKAEDNKQTVKSKSVDRVNRVSRERRISDDSKNEKRQGGLERMHRNESNRKQFVSEFTGSRASSHKMEESHQNYQKRTYSRMRGPQSPHLSQNAREFEIENYLKAYKKENAWRIEDATNFIQERWQELEQWHLKGFYSETHARATFNNLEEFHQIMFSLSETEFSKAESAAHKVEKNAYYNLGHTYKRLYGEMSCLMTVMEAVLCLAQSKAFLEKVDNFSPQGKTQEYLQDMEERLDFLKKYLQDVIDQIRTMHKQFPLQWKKVWDFTQQICQDYQLRILQFDRDYKRPETVNYIQASPDMQMMNSNILLQNQMQFIAQPPFAQNVDTTNQIPFSGQFQHFQHLPFQSLPTQFQNQQLHNANMHCYGQIQGNSFGHNHFGVQCFQRPKHLYTKKQFPPGGLWTKKYRKQFQTLAASGQCHWNVAARITKAKNMGLKRFKTQFPGSNSFIEGIKTKQRILKLDPEEVKSSLCARQRKFKPLAAKYYFKQIRESNSINNPAESNNNREHVTEYEISRNVPKPWMSVDHNDTSESFQNPPKGAIISEEVIPNCEERDFPWSESGSASYMENTLAPIPTSRGMDKQEYHQPKFKVCLIGDSTASHPTGEEQVVYLDKDIVFHINTSVHSFEALKSYLQNLENKSEYDLLVVHCGTTNVSSNTAERCKKLVKQCEVALKKAIQLGQAPTTVLWSGVLCTKEEAARDVATVNGYIHSICQYNDWYFFDNSQMHQACILSNDYKEFRLTRNASENLFQKLLTRLEMLKAKLFRKAKSIEVKTEQPAYNWDEKSKHPSFTNQSFYPKKEALVRPPAHPVQVICFIDLAAHNAMNLSLLKRELPNANFKLNLRTWTLQSLLSEMHDLPKYCFDIAILHVGAADVLQTASGVKVLKAFHLLEDFLIRENYFKKVILSSLFPFSNEDRLPTFKLNIKTSLNRTMKAACTDNGWAFLDHSMFGRDSYAGSEAREFIVYLKPESRKIYNTQLLEALKSAIYSIVGLTSVVSKTSEGGEQKPAKPVIKQKLSRTWSVEQSDQGMTKRSLPIQSKERPSVHESNTSDINVTLDIDNRPTTNINMKHIQPETKISKHTENSQQTCDATPDTQCQQPIQVSEEPKMVTSDQPSTCPDTNKAPNEPSSLYSFMHGNRVWSISRPSPVTKVRQSDYTADKDKDQNNETIHQPSSMSKENKDEKKVQMASSAGWMGKMKHKIPLHSSEEDEPSAPVFTPKKHKVCTERCKTKAGASVWIGPRKSLGLGIRKINVTRSLEPRPAPAKAATDQYLSSSEQTSDSDSDDKGNDIKRKKSKKKKKKKYKSKNKSNASSKKQLKKERKLQKKEAKKCKKEKVYTS